MKYTIRFWLDSWINETVTDSRLSANALINALSKEFPHIEAFDDIGRQFANIHPR